MYIFFYIFFFWIGRLCNIKFFLLSLINNLWNELFSYLKLALAITWSQSKCSLSIVRWINYIVYANRTVFLIIKVRRRSNVRCTSFKWIFWFFCVLRLRLVTLLRIGRVAILLLGEEDVISGNHRFWCKAHVLMLGIGIKCLLSEWRCRTIITIIVYLF